ncbi:MAG TPA: ATP-binding protein [Azonexus sp.]|nr:ATP-binding protein [Azonexus sp.]
MKRRAGRLGRCARAFSGVLLLSLSCALPALAEAASLALYRVVQEALTNVVRHSGARHCRVGIECRAAALLLCIEDDGQGLPADRPAHQGGLLGMVERLDMVGGRLQVAGGPGRGVQLQVSLPLQEEETKEEEQDDPHNSG